MRRCCIAGQPGAVVRLRNTPVMVLVEHLRAMTPGDAVTARSPDRQKPRPAGLRSYRRAWLVGTASPIRMRSRGYACFKSPFRFPRITRSDDARSAACRHPCARTERNSGKVTATMTSRVMNEEPARLLRVGEAAKLLGVHPGTLRKWSGDGLIPCYRVGRRRDRRFHRTDLERFLIGEKGLWTTANGALAS